MTACSMCGFSPDAPVSARWEFVLEKRLTSANLRTVNAGASRWRYAKDRDEWFMWLRTRAPLAARNAPSSKRRVTITRRYSGRCQEMDRDNLVAGTKTLVDAMVRDSVVHDDGCAWLELHVLQVRGEHNETHVVVEELA